MNDIYDLSTKKELFDKYDIKRQNSLGLTELETLFYDVLIELGENDAEDRKLEIAKEGLEIFDKNKNGTIEFNEFLDLIEFLILEKGYEI